MQRGAGERSFMSKTPEETMKHLDEMTLLLYIERQLDRARGLEVSAHTQECDSCRTLLRAMERESRLLTRAMLEEDEPLPARLAQLQERARRSMQWIWGVVFGLAATGVYELYTGYIQPWQQQLEMAGFSGSNLLGLLIFQGAMWKGWQSVITLLEVLAMVTLAGLGAMFFRRRIRRGSALALVFAGLCTVLALPMGASATEFRHDKQVTIAKDEVIHSDLYAAGGRIRIEGTIEGDLVAAGGEVEITGHVMGDVLSSSGALRLLGKVDGNIRSYAGNVSLKGTVGRNVTVFGGELILDREAKIGGSLTGFCGEESIDGHLGRDLLTFAGQVNITGNIGGSARITGGELHIDSSAQIEGPIHFQGDRPAVVSAGAKLASPVQFERLKHGPDYSNWHYYLWQVIWAAAYILFGLVLFALMPEFSADAVKSAERYGASAGLAVLVGFGVPIAACIACITMVGLFVGLATLSVWYGSLYFGEVIVGAVIGQWLMGRTSDLWPLIGRMTVGLIILRLCTTIPHVGGWVKYVAAFWGLGAISLALYRRFQPVISANAPSSAPYTPPMPPNTTIGGPLPA
jgi:cytoskeletal protein CcmA (bactofilin family)